MNGCSEIHVVGAFGVLDKLNEHFRIGVRLEGVAMLHETFLEDVVVLNDTVVDDGQLLRLGVVRMGIDLIGFAVGSPTGVSDADETRCVLVCDCLFEVGDFALCLIDVELPVVVDECNACAVVTTIFQTVQAFDENRIGFAFTDISYYSTHKDIYYLVIYYLFIYLGCKSTAFF